MKPKNAPSSCSGSPLELAFWPGWPTAVREMQTDHIVEIAVRHLFGRIIRRALLACVIMACVIAAIYHFTVAGFLTLDAQFGDLQARLIVGGIYAAFALIGFAIWWAMRG